MRRASMLKRYVKNNSVLDLGCVQHTWKAYKSPNWLHKFLIDDAKEVVGLDFLKKDVEKLQKLGYNIVEGDAENYDLKRTFDVIIAAELIEHLINPGGFLDSARKHMSKNSVLIITTPNAFCLGNIFRIIKLTLGFKLKDNPEHTQWYDAQTLRQAVERKGLKVKRMDFFSADRYSNFKDSLIPKKVKGKLFCVAQIK